MESSTLILFGLLFEIFTASLDFPKAELHWLVCRKFFATMMNGDSGRIVCSNRSLSRGSKRSFGRILRETSIRIPFPSLEKSRESDEEEYNGILRKRREADYLKKRQMFVSSYQFTVKRTTVSEKLRASCRKVRVSVRETFACKYCNSLVSGLKGCDRNGNRCMGCFGRCWPALRLPHRMGMP